MRKKEVEVKVLPTHRETRCRYCWARISRGNEAAEVYSVFFHVDCPKEITDFPVIGKIDDHGRSTAPVGVGVEPDNPYEHLRVDRAAEGIRS